MDIVEETEAPLLEGSLFLKVSDEDFEEEEISGETEQQEEEDNG